MLSDKQQVRVKLHLPVDRQHLGHLLLHLALLQPLSAVCVSAGLKKKSVICGKETILKQCYLADPETSIFMIIGDYPVTNNVEEFKTNSRQEDGCPIPNSFPVTIYDAEGANMSEHKQLFC